MTRDYNVVMVGPSRVGKTSCLAAMIDDLNTLLGKIHYGTPLPTELVTKKKILIDTVEDTSKNQFKMNDPGLGGSSAKEEHPIYLCRQGLGTDASDVKINFIDLPGRWYKTDDPDYKKAEELRGGWHYLGQKSV
jgi:GTPase SAR1 family protein